MSGFSLDSLSAGQVLGFSANPRTTDNFDTKKHRETTITNASNAYHPVKQPTNANRVQTLLQPAQQPSQTSQNQPSDQTPEGRPPSQMFISALPTLNISIPEWKQFLYSHSPNNYKTVLHGHKLAYCECTSLPELLRWFRTFYAY